MTFTSDGGILPILLFRKQTKQSYEFHIFRSEKVIRLPLSVRPQPVLQVAPDDLRILVQGFNTLFTAGRVQRLGVPRAHRFDV